MLGSIGCVSGSLTAAQLDGTDRCSRRRWSPGPLGCTRAPGWGLGNRSESGSFRSHHACPVENPYPTQDSFSQFRAPYRPHDGVSRSPGDITRRPCSFGTAEPHVGVGFSRHGRAMIRYHVRYESGVPRTNGQSRLTGATHSTATASMGRLLCVDGSRRSPPWCYTVRGVRSHCNETGEHPRVLPRPRSVSRIEDQGHLPSEGTS